MTTNNGILNSYDDIFITDDDFFIANDGIMTLNDGRSGQKVIEKPVIKGYAVL